jgi:hypothetical protein
MRIKQFAKTLFLCLGIAFSFAGCTNYVSVPCSIETPQRLYVNERCKQDNDFEFAKCVIIAKEALIADYNNLLLAFEACK